MQISLIGESLLGRKHDENTLRKNLMENKSIPEA